jgi:hypothetical protein
MIFRYATMSVTGLLLAIIWMGHAPYLHDFGEWVFQSRVLTLHWLNPGEVDWVLSALAGALVGSVWNYATTAVYTWKAR